MSLKKRPLLLIVRDGWGHNPYEKWNHANAVRLAKVPVDERLRATYPWVQIKTSGEDVGLPDGVMGNSEVGHQNIGAGRIVDQELMRISNRIRDNSFFENPRLLGAFAHARKNGGAVHLLGLCSDGRVHSDLEHLFALLEMGKKKDPAGVPIYIHGRDRDMQDDLRPAPPPMVPTVPSAMADENSGKSSGGVRWLFVGGTGLFVLVLLCGGGLYWLYTSSQAEVEQVVNAFQTQLDAENYAAAYQAIGPEWKLINSQAAFTEFESTIFSQLGKLQSKTMFSFNVHARAGGQAQCFGGFAQAARDGMQSGMRVAHDG